MRWGGQGGPGGGARWAPLYARRPACHRGRGHGPLRSAGPAGPGVACRSRERRGRRAGARCSPGGRGHGPPEWRCPVGPGGWVAPGLCAAPGIPALGGRGARPWAEPTGSPPPGTKSGPGGGGGGEGAGGRGEGGGGLAEEVLTLQPLGDGPLLAFPAGAAPPGLLAALQAFFPVEAAPPGEGEGPEPQAGDLDLGLEFDVDEDDKKC